MEEVRRKWGGNRKGMVGVGRGVKGIGRVW